MCNFPKMPFIRVFQRLKCLKLASHVLKCNKLPACSHISSIIPPSGRPFCAQFQCLWPPNLPPATEWGYGINGPDTWPTKYPAAAGLHQSPVDIPATGVHPRTFDPPLRWQYDSHCAETLLNQGCGWRVDVKPHTSEVTGGPLLHNYELVQFHCHWGSCSECGSEHTIDGKPYAGELHFVHWNKELFETCSDAVPATRGLAVIGVFLQEGDPNPEIQKLCDLLTQVPEKDDRVEFTEDVNPVAMFPEDTSFWTYNGSLTTPPCYESVTWIVFKNPITISKEQLDCFRQMKKADEPGCVVSNFRPPQSLNDRQIEECNAV